MSALRICRSRNDADRHVPLLLRMRWVSRFASAKIRGLLRLLFVWLGAVPAGATGAKLLLRYQRRRCTLSHNQDAPSTRRLACFVRPHTRTRSVMQIRVDDLTGTEVRALLAEHLRNMHQLSPPESVHALDLTALLKPEITFWTVWFHGELLGCGALKELTPAHGEIKSMRTASTHRRKGVARATLQHIIAEARGGLTLASASKRAPSQLSSQPAGCTKPSASHIVRRSRATPKTRTVSS